MLTNRNELLISILRWIAGTQRKVAPIAYILAQARSEVWPQLTNAELLAELEALAKDEGLLEKVYELSAEASTWRLTNKGRNFLIEKGITN
jgi:hypothetical protein